MKGVNGIKLFSATMQRDRDTLGERATAWIRENPAIEIVDIRVTQSSDEAFHCVTLTILYTEKKR